VPSGPPWRRLLGSYQARLALALGVFFVTPSAVLAVLSIGQLRAEAVQTQDLVLQRVLRDASPVARFGAGLADSSVRTDIRTLARRVDADLGFYRDGVLVASSDPLLTDLAVFPRLLDAQAYHSIHLDGDLSAAPHDGAMPTLAGYASAGLAGGAGLGVLATVAPATDLALQERQADVGYILVLVTLLGMLAALAAARTAARALSQPVADLRESALAFGRGDAIPARRGSTPMEFTPVFDAFGRMAADVRGSQAALEAARLRLELVLATASTGVIALDAEGRILLANVQAEDALGRTLPHGPVLGELLAPGWEPLRTLVGQMLAGAGEPESGIEVDAGGRRFVVRAAALAGELGGLVLALTDVTEATIAARVLAWADVANQVAHAIKNPLTPLRLGMQHLARVSQEHPEKLDATLRETSSRILAEIDRLDDIARAFSRFAAPSEAGRPLEMVQVGETLKEVAALYHLAPGVTVLTDAPPGATVPARRDELTEVLLNLCDNAGHAGARTITMRLADSVLEIHDDGHGIPAEHMGRIFEPRFSTTSSGSGLGLAIVRRVVEGWGGSVGVESQAGKGTTFRIRFGPASNVRPAGSV
jgi:nitrogen fixation/metabolism regulation signal transduction histidine kinase